MGSSELQNTQRGIVFVFFLSILLIFVFLVIKVVKKLTEFGTESQAKYTAKSEPKIPKEVVESSDVSLANTLPKKDDTAASKASSKAEDPSKKAEAPAQEVSPVIRVIKVMDELGECYLPHLMTLALTFDVGASYAFSLVDFFLIGGSLLLFNLLKVHRFYVENRILRVILEHLWIFWNFWMVVNNWTARISTQPYMIVSA